MNLIIALLDNDTKPDKKMKDESDYSADDDEEIVIIRRKKQKRKFFSNSTIDVRIHSRLEMKWLFMLLIVLSLFARYSAAPSGFPGYKPTASVTNFRNVRHNPVLEQFLKNINNVNESISTVQADHIAVKSFIHPINETLKEVLMA